MDPAKHLDGEVLPPTQGRPVPDFDTERAEARVVHPPFTPPPAAVRRRTSTSATYILLGINIGVFVWMLLHGVSPTSPTPDQLVHFGANATDLVLAGQWYRLLTATFVHVGVIHLATNMWCLYNLGLLGEPLLGKWGLIATYLVTGIAGNLLSLAVNVILFVVTRTPDLSVGAGASGAVFGIAGILIVLLSNKKLPIPLGELQRLRRSVIQFAGLNLVIGLATVIVPLVRIDNMAHIGGFLSGLALGVPLVPRMTSGRQLYLRRQKFTFASACLILPLFGYWIVNLIRV